MRRYVNDYQRAAGMEMGRLPRRRPMGMDPNYRGGAYCGQRFAEEGGAAPYGRYRLEHGAEVEEYGGYRGRYTGAGQLRDVGNTPPSGPAGPPRPRSLGPGGRGQEPYGARSASPGSPRRGGWRRGEYPADYGRPPAGGGFGEQWGGPAARGPRADRFRSPPPRRYCGEYGRREGYRGGEFSRRYLGAGF